MRRLQIMIEEELDDALARQAAEEGVSKAALVRRYVGERLRPVQPLEEDPLWGLCGIGGDAESVENIDEFLYGPITHGE